MPCPFASVFGAFATVGGAHTLLVRDRAFRILAWGVLAGLIAAWVAYFLLARTVPLRITLEVLSVAALVAGILRVRWLMRAKGWTPPLYGTMTRLARATWAVLGTPWVLAAKIWLAAMLVMEWRGKAHFSSGEYGIVGAVLAALIVVRLFTLRRSRPAFATLESMAGASPAAACPFGFGCEAAAAPNAAGAAQVARSQGSEELNVARG